MELMKGELRNLNRSSELHNSILMEEREKSQVQVEEMNLKLSQMLKSCEENELSKKGLENEVMKLQLEIEKAHEAQNQTQKDFEESLKEEKRTSLLLENRAHRLSKEMKMTKEALQVKNDELKSDTIRVERKYRESEYYRNKLRNFLNTLYVDVLKGDVDPEALSLDRFLPLFRTKLKRQVEEKMHLALQVESMDLKIERQKERIRQSKNDNLNLSMSLDEKAGELKKKERENLLSRSEMRQLKEKERELESAVQKKEELIGLMDERLQFLGKEKKGFEQDSKALQDENLLLKSQHRRLQSETRKIKSILVEADADDMSPFDEVPSEIKAEDDEKYEEEDDDDDDSVFQSSILTNDSKKKKSRRYGSSYLNTSLGPVIDELNCSKELVSKISRKNRRAKTDLSDLNRGLKKARENVQRLQKSTEMASPKKGKKRFY